MTISVNMKRFLIIIIVIALLPFFSFMMNFLSKVILSLHPQFLKVGLLIKRKI